MRLAADMSFGKNDLRQFNGIFDCLAKIYQSDGVKGVYRGCLMGTIGIFVYRGLYFGIFDTGRGL